MMLAINLSFFKGASDSTMGKKLKGHVGSKGQMSDQDLLWSALKNVSI